MKRCGALLSVFFVSASLWAAETDSKQITSEQLVEQLQAAISKAIKESKESKDAKGGGTEDAGKRETSYYLAQIATAVKRAKSRGEAENLPQILAQVQSLAANEEIANLCTALLEQLEKEGAARDQAAVDAVNAAVEKAVTLCFAATDPKELDASIVELSTYSLRSEYSSRDAARRAAEKARTAVDFLCKWQDYLSQMKSGNVDAAAAVLVALSKETANYPFAPRSQILDRIKPGTVRSDDGQAAQPAPAAPVPPSLKGKTLADLEDLKQALRELQAKNRNAQQVQEVLQQVVALDRAYEEFSIGLVGQAFSYCTSSDNYGNASPDLFPMRQELLIQVLPPYLGVEKTYPAAAKEMPADYLQRVIQESRDKSDWITLWKALEAYRTVAFRGQGPNWLQADINGVTQLIIARNMEKAGQYVDAIRAYKRVLSQAGQNLPVDVTSERLKVLQKEHPEEYEIASKPIEQPPRVIQMGPNAPVVPTR